MRDQAEIVGILWADDSKANQQVELRQRCIEHEIIRRTQRLFQSLQRPQRELSDLAVVIAGLEVGWQLEVIVELYADAEAFCGLDHHGGEAGRTRTLRQRRSDAGLF